MDARRIDWHGGISERTVRAVFERAAGTSVDGWDGYYAGVAVSEGAGTILTVDTDLDGVEGVGTEVVLTPEEHERLAEFLGCRWGVANESIGSTANHTEIVIITLPNTQRIPIIEVVYDGTYVAFRDC